MVTSSVVNNSSLGLYLHIPFCKQKCHYCDFLITLQSKKTDRAKFINLLRSQVECLSSYYSQSKIETIYFGGGTPSLLEDKELEEILIFLRKSFNFVSSPEITLECNPDDVDQKRVENWMKIGINRLSLGVQSFDDDVLKQLGRNHTAETTKQAVQILKKMNFPNISFDLMMAIPNQNVKKWKETLHEALNYDPDHISVYDLEIQPKTYFNELLRRGQIKPSSQSDSSKMAEQSEDVLLKSGYRQYEIASFAKPGFECAHNQRYWNHQDYLGLGPGAFSYINDERFQYADTLNKYAEKSIQKKWDKSFSERIVGVEKEKEILLTQIRLDKGLQLESIKSIRKQLMPRLETLAQEQLIEMNEKRVKLTGRGRKVYESVVSELLCGIQK